MSSRPQGNEDSLANFATKVMNVTTNGMLCLVIALGKELKIFETLGEISSKENPVLAEAIAEKAGLKERYVREWLASMACAHFVDVTDDGERFWIANEKKAVLCCDHEALEMLVFTQQFVPIYKTMIDVFRIDGPKGTTYDQYSDIITRLSKMSKGFYEKHLIADIVPLIEVQECALNNLEMLDVGCGNGDIVNMLAKHYPQSQFFGIDNFVNAISKATQSAIEENLSNVTFEKQDAAHLPEGWTGRFDLVTIFDACHDQMRPDLGLKEIYRVLKPGGVLAMMEIKGTSNVYEDRKDGDVAAIQYGISLFHCLPIGYNSEDALGLGTKWGEKRAKQLLGYAGFQSVEVVDLPFTSWNVLYRCHKI